ncbi:MAG: hypothetical protein OCD00_11075 [Colwellia sp.]
MALSGMAESIVKFVGFIKYAVSTYRGVVDPFFEFIFGWLPFHVPVFCHDYLVVAVIYFMSQLKVMSSMMHFDVYTPSITPALFTTTAIWPITIILHIRVALYGKPESYFDEILFFAIKKNLFSMLTTFLLFVIVIIINQTITMFGIT